MEEFLSYVVGLEYDTKPDYDRCRQMFSSALKKLRLPSDGKVDFSATKSPLKKVGNSSKIPAVESTISSPSTSSSKKKTGASKKKTAAEVAVAKKSPGGKVTKKRTVAVKKSPIKKKLTKDMSTQISPGFAKQAKAKAKLLKQKQQQKIVDESVVDNEMDTFLKKAKTAATKANAKNAKKAEIENASGMSNPTPAMLAILNKKQNDSNSKRKPKSSNNSSESNISTPSSTPTRSSKRTRK